MKTQLRPPVTYYGGKQNLTSTILPLIPEHSLYCEPFLGGGAIFWAKPKSKVEVINDLDGFVVNFYQQCVSNFDQLQAKIAQTPHSRSLHADAYVMYQNPHLFDDLEKAWAFWVLSNQSMLAILGNTWAAGNKDNKRESALSNKRSGFLAHYKERLDLVQIESRPALHIIKSRDSESTFFYLDPPYYNSNMGHYGGYTLQDFEDLLKMLTGLKGKFLLSSYPSEVLSDYSQKHGWQSREIEMNLSASKKGKRKIEVLTANYNI